MASNNYPRTYSRGYGGGVGMNTGHNPFDISQFNEVRPTYVGPPIEELNGAREYLTKTSKENRLSQGLLDQAFTKSIDDMQGDPDGVNLILEHKHKFEDDIANITNTSNLAYAGPAIQNHVNAFARDYRIAGRQGVMDDINGFKDGIKANKNLSPEIKKLYASYNYKATRDDEHAIYQMEEPPTPYEKVDINAKFINSLKTALAVPDGYAFKRIAFYDSQGHETTDINRAQNRKVIFVNSSGKTLEEKVTPARIKALYEGLFATDPSAAGYILQEALVGDYYANGEKGLNPIDTMGRIKGDTKLYDKVTGDIADKFAKAFSYNRVIGSEDLKGIATGYTDPNVTPAGKAADPFNPYEYPNEATNSRTTNTDVPTIEKRKQAALDTANKLLTGNDAAAATTGEIKEAAKYAQKGDLVALDQYYTDHHIGTSSLARDSRAIRNAYNDAELASAKYKNAKDAVLKTNSYYSKLFDEPLNNNIEIDGKVFNLADFPGTDYVQKADAMRNALYNKYSSSAWSPSVGIGGIGQHSTSWHVDNITRDRITSFLADLNAEVNPKRSLSRHYNKEVNTKLAEKNHPSTSISTTNLSVSGTLKGNKEALNELKRIFKNGANLEGMDIENENGDKFGGIKFLADNYEVSEVFLTNHSVGTAPRSYKVIYSRKPNANVSGDSKVVYVPLGNTGVTNKFFQQYIANNPRYRAQELTNNYKMSNIEGEFKYSTYPEFTYNQKMAPDSNNKLKPIGEYEYTGRDSNGNTVTFNDEIAFNEALAARIAADDEFQRNRFNVYSYSKELKNRMTSYPDLYNNLLSIDVGDAAMVGTGNNARPNDELIALQKQVEDMLPKDGFTKADAMRIAGMLVLHKKLNLQ